MNPVTLGALTVTKPVAVGIVVGALVLLYLAFKVGKFLIKTLLWLLLLIAIGLVAWWFLKTHHGSL